MVDSSRKTPDPYLFEAIKHFKDNSTLLKYLPHGSHDITVTFRDTTEEQEFDEINYDPLRPGAL
jgi:hypothetical protein